MEVIKTLEIKAIEEELKKMYEKTNELFLENGDDPLNSFEEWKNYFTKELTIFDVQDTIDEFDWYNIIKVHREYKVKLEEKI